MAEKETEIMTKGWHREPARHSLAARGLRSCPSKFKSLIQEPRTDAKPRADVKKLKQYILSNFGGEGFQLNWFMNQELSKRDVKRLQEDGEIINGQDFKFKRMGTSMCHYNSSILAVDNGMDIYTGLALSDDGLWRVHTWTYNPKKNKMIETTEKRVRYFGYKLNEIEVEDFISSNL